MQKIFLEKMVDLDHQMSELLSISVDESINYKIEEAGMRAQGRIDITGEYLKSASKERFNQYLDIDILAPFNKVTDQHDFSIKIEDFDYKIQAGNLLVTIEAIVYGVEASEDRFYNDQNLRDDELDQELIDEIKDVISSPEIIEENISEKEVAEEKEEVTMTAKKRVADEKMPEEKKEEETDQRDPSIDDLIEISDQNDLVPYYIFVAGEEDDYDTIAKRYSVPASVIKDYNHDQTVAKGTLIIVPYYES